VGRQGERCSQTPELFGQINDPDIVAIEVLVDDQWHRYDARKPGFAIRLDGASGRPARYRWLDAEGKTVWEIPPQSPTSPDG
jgi:hypothetical protein